MINGIIGKKVGMTQLFAADGTVIPVTVIKAGPCVVVQKKTAGGRDGYDAVQLGLVEDRPIRMKNVNKPMRGHFEKTGGGIPPTRILKEFRLTAADEATNVGDKILVDQFADGDIVEVAANFVCYRYRRYERIREYVGAYRYILKRAGDSFRIKERRVLIDAHELGSLGSVSFIL